MASVRSLQRQHGSQRRFRCLTVAALAVLVSVLMQTARATPSNPYAHLPLDGDSVRFDASAAGETHAWAYPSLNYLEAFLRSTIDAAADSSSYEEYKTKMAAVLDKSVSLSNGTPASVQHVQSFVYRGHQDVEVQVKVAAGILNHSLVWTTPAELVDANGHKYLH